MSLCVLRLVTVIVSWFSTTSIICWREIDALHVVFDVCLSSLSKSFAAYQLLCGHLNSSVSHPPHFACYVYACCLRCSWLNFIRCHCERQTDACGRHERSCCDGGFTWFLSVVCPDELFSADHYARHEVVGLVLSSSLFHWFTGRAISTDFALLLLHLVYFLCCKIPWTINCKICGKINI